MRPGYRPSNGTEGEIFQSAWCARCRRDASDSCPILLRTMAFGLDDPEYPTEWTFADDGTPVCTAFIDRHAPRRGFRCRRTADLFGATS